MKYFFASVMLLCVVCLGLAAMAAMTYQYLGQGLHPALAAAVGLLCVVAGSFAALQIDRSEDD